MSATLRVEGDGVVGELALVLHPGTRATDRDRAIDEALAAPLLEAATALGVVLGAAPTAYARELPGRDEAGRTRFVVAGRIEGERLLPVRRPSGPAEGRRGR